MLDQKTIVSILIPIIIVFCYYQYVLKNRCFMVECSQNNLEKCKFYHGNKCMKYIRKYIK